MVLVLLCSSCTFFTPENQSETGYYDLAHPEKIMLSVPVRVQNFTSSANERFRMSYRKDEVTLYSSDQSRWAQTPGNMLTKYLRLAFRNEEKDKPCPGKDPLIVSGEVLAFETTGTIAELAVNYTLQYKGRSVSKTVLFKEKMKHFSGQDFARAMSKASGRFARLIANESTMLVRKK